jgi:hypothetical protein
VAVFAGIEGEGGLMIYSCFDEPTGLYRYFQDDKNQALNSDLPVPKFSAAERTKAGIPAVVAARPFPEGATYVGTGWAAKGMIVKCPSGGLSMSGVFDTSTWPSWWPYAAGAGAGLLAFFLIRSSR